MTLVRCSEWRCTKCDTPWIVVWWVSEEIRRQQFSDSLRSDGQSNPRITFTHSDGVVCTAWALATEHARQCGSELRAVAA